MKTRLLKILDKDTSYFCVVNQFENTDEKICQEIGISTNYRIINEFKGSCVCTYASYDFHPSHFQNKVVDAESYEGTTKAIGNILNSIGDLRYLPEEINAESVRNYYNVLKGFDPFLEKYKEMDPVYNAELRKILFQSNGKYYLKIFDLNDNNRCVFEQFFPKKELIVPIYLLLPEEKLDESLVKKMGIKNVIC